MADHDTPPEPPPKDTVLQELPGEHELPPPSVGLDMATRPTERPPRTGTRYEPPPPEQPFVAEERASRPPAERTYRTPTWTLMVQAHGPFHDVNLGRIDVVDQGYGHWACTLRNVSDTANVRSANGFGSSSEAAAWGFRQAAEMLEQVRSDKRAR